jgi:hypothetical protein
MPFEAEDDEEALIYIKEIFHKCGGSKDGNFKNHEK